MTSENQPEWLPSGWTMQVTDTNGRKFECYHNPEGRKFYSKPEVFQYLETIKNCTTSEKNHNGDLLTGEKSASQPELSKGNQISESLPDGWVVELSTQSNGRKYKCYVEPESGRKFYSKPAVSRHLKAVNSSKASEKTGEKSSSEPGMSQNSEATGVRHSMSRKKKNSIRKSNFCKVLSRTPADGLPPGWIKELRTRKNAPRTKDPYYIDPVSGYIFFSKLDALRYVDTGDIKNCATKPMKKDINGKETSNYAVDGQKSANTRTRRQLFEEADNSNETPDKATAIDASIPTTDTLEENHTHVKSTDPETAERASISTLPSEMKTPENKIARRSTRTNKSKKPSATLPGRSSKRLKAPKPETKSEVHPEKEKNDGNIHMEKQTNEPGDSTGTDFAVKMLIGEMPVNVSSVSVSCQVGLQNENPTKVN